MLQFGQHIHQRRVKRRVEQSQIVMNEGRHRVIVERLKNYLQLTAIIAIKPLL